MFSVGKINLLNKMLYPHRLYLFSSNLQSYCSFSTCLKDFLNKQYFKNSYCFNTALHQSFKNKFSPILYCLQFGSSWLVKLLLFNLLRSIFLISRHYVVLSLLKILYSEEQTVVWSNADTSINNKTRITVFPEIPLR